jgi:hypothetical protein
MITYQKNCAKGVKNAGVMPAWFSFVKTRASLNMTEFGNFWSKYLEESYCVKL